MNHPFNPNKENIKVCQDCQLGYVSHTPMAICSNCNNRGNCDIFDGRLLCQKCNNLAQNSLKNNIVQSEQLINPVLAQAKEIDNSITFNGDIFNAETIAHIDIKKAIDSDNNIANKALKFQETLIERFEHFQKTIFELDENKHKLEVNKLAIAKTLRDLGNELREEFRNKLRDSDKLYKPSQPIPVLKKEKAPKISPYENMIQIIMNTKNVNRDEAERIFAGAKSNLKVE